MHWKSNECRAAVRSSVFVLSCLVLETETKRNGTERNKAEQNKNAHAKTKTKQNKTDAKLCVVSRAEPVYAICLLVGTACNLFVGGNRV
jgi:hypothetical protein